MKITKSRNVLILGGSSDIGIEVIRIFLKRQWKVTAHFSKNKKKLENIRRKTKDLNLIKFNFLNYKNYNVEKLIKRKFNKKYDSVVNLVGYIDNKGFENTNLKSILKSLATNTILPILIEKMLVKKMLNNNWGRILNCSGIDSLVKQ